jgi:inosine/xanthosine triphosphatase
MTIRVVVASNNPVKIEAVRLGFVTWLKEDEIIVTGIDVPSGIGKQPMTDSETYLGASNRVNSATQALPDADFWVGIEGGVEELPDGMAAYAWIIVRSKTRTGVAR